MSKITKDEIFLVAEALNHYCGNNDAHDSCNWRASEITSLPAEDPRYETTFSFKNSDGRSFFLDCAVDNNKNRCDLRVARKYLFGGGDGAIFSCSGYPSSKDETYFDIYPDAAISDNSSLGARCEPTSRMFAPKASEEPIEYTPQTDNFYDSVVVYMNSGISEEEREFAMANINIAAEHVAMFTEKYLGLAPLFGEVELFYRPSCEGMDPKVAGSTYYDQIQLVPSYCDYKEQENWKCDMSHLKSIIVHELLHTYFEPWLAEDPSRIFEEGLTTYIQFNLNAKTCKSGLNNEMFPDSPVFPYMVQENIYPGMEAEISGSDGKSYHLTINDMDQSIEGSLNGIIFSLENGNCFLQNEDNGYFICSHIDNGKTNLLFFGQESVVRKISLSTITNNPLSFKVGYAGYNFIWGYDSLDAPRIFKDTPISSHGITETFVQTDYKMSNAQQYFSAYLMISGLEQLFWAEYPDRDPNSVIRAFGEINNEFRERAYEYGYDPSETNIYHLICDKLDLPQDKCFAVFESFGLDPEFYLSSKETLNFCLPGQSWHDPFVPPL